MSEAPDAKLRVYVDVREKGSTVASLLERKLLVVYKRLDIGDYLVSNDVVIERKTVSDYIKSLYDGRLFDQASRMASSYSYPMIIVEGKYVSYKDRVKFYSSLASLAITYGLHILMANNSQDAAEVIYYIAKRIYSNRGQFIVIHKKPKLSGLKDWQLYIVQSLPHVGPKLAKRLLERFGSVEGIVNARLSDLAKIPGIGEKRALELYKVLHTSYSSHSEKSYRLDDFT
ncbi:MAG: helix-hairpin-helix domain-containing protein [Desulfurococcales archaeon]|nr:helix-hairpin-helix domain-containing protein [Desulfurococcales archaeon]